tara:strand:+ start:1 stop:2469 length:2469 start_codon:yes stop_codon:yes gene_type:complete
MGLNEIMDNLDRRISERKDYASKKGRWPKRLLDEYNRLYPDREIPFGDWMRTLPPGRGPASISPKPAGEMAQGEWNREIDETIGPTEDPIQLPINERYRPNVIREEKKELADLGKGYRDLQKLHQKDVEERWRRTLPPNEQWRTHPNVKDPNYTAEKTATGERISFVEPLLVEGEYWSPPVESKVRFDAPPMDKLVGPQKDEAYKKERVVKPYVAPVKKKGRKNLWGDDDDEPSEGSPWGSALGKGLAAFGDAFALAGGAKTSFLNNIIKTERLKEKQPWERFKTFTKLLQAEVNNDLLQLHRFGGRQEKRLAREQRGKEHKETLAQRKLEYKGSSEQRAKQFYGNLELRKELMIQNWINFNRSYDVNLQKLDLMKADGKREAEKYVRDKLEKEPGSKLMAYEMEKVLYDKDHRMFPSWLHKLAKENPKGFMKFTVKDIKSQASKYAQLRTALAKKDPKASVKEMMAGFQSPESQAIIQESFKKDPSKITALEFSGFSKTIPGTAKALDNWTRGESKGLAFSKKIVTNTRAIVKAIGEQLGVPSITRDQLQADVGRNKFWFIPKDIDGRLDRAKRVEVDIAGMQLPGGGGLTSIIDTMDGTGWAGLLRQLAEKSYAPERRENFGASQSFRELEKYMIGIGDAASFRGREVAQLNYLLGLGDKAQKGLTTYSNKLSGKAGGKYKLSQEGYNYRGYYNPETKKYAPQYSSPDIAASFATKVYLKNRNDDYSVDSFRMPSFWNETIKKVQSVHDSGKNTWYYHYPQRQEKAADGKIITVNSNQNPDIIGKFTKYKVGSGDSPNNWTPEVWIEFIRQYGINPRKWD